MNRQSGYGLVTVLIATAIVGIMFAGVLYVVDMVSTTVARNAAGEQIESAVRTIQGIVASKDLCDNALRGADAATRIRYNPGPLPGISPRVEQPVQNIYLQRVHNEPGATRVIGQGMNIGLAYRIQRIAIAERVIGQGRGQLTLDGVVHLTYSTELLIDVFNNELSEISADGTNAARLASGMRQRAIPMNIVVSLGADNTPNTGDDEIIRCYQDSSVQFLCEQLGGTYVNGSCTGVLSNTETDCRAELAGPPSAPGDCPNNTNPAIQCDKVYYVAGFQATSATKPQCRCQLVCRSGSTPTGGSTSAVTSSVVTSTNPAAGAATTGGAGGN